MTAAHCIFDDHGNLRNKNQIEVYLGLHSIADIGLNTSTTVTEHRYAVERFIFDKRFNIINRKLDYDFALMRLKRPIVFSSAVQPICVPENELRTYDQLIVAGWGRLSPTKSAPETLQEARVDHIDSKFLSI